MLASLSRNVALAVALSSMMTPAVAQNPAGLSSSAAWYADYLKHSRLVRLPDGRSLNLYCLGSGSPTVILEGGLGGSAFSWWTVQNPVAKLTRVCAYDRAGAGRSPPGPFPRDTRAQVQDLESLLSAARIGKPYVLVGHSMGGYNVRLFASRHLSEVAGLVFVDPSVENQLPIIHAAAPAIEAQDNVSISRARACADPKRSAEVAGLCTQPPPSDFPADLAKSFAATLGLAQSQTYYSELQGFVDMDSQEVAAESRSFGAIPLIVLTRSELATNVPADQAATEWRLWNQMHDRVASLSSVGKNRVVEGSGHYIQLDRPAAVIDAITEVVKAARSGR